MCEYCEKIVEEINTQYPNANWNMDEACIMWHKLESGIPDMGIQHEEFSDENYSCNCPNCGAMICGWCI